MMTVPPDVDVMLSGAIPKARNFDAIRGVRNAEDNCGGAAEA